MSGTNFIQLEETDYHDTIYVNMPQINYIHREARTIRLSDGLVLHLTKKSMEKLMKRITEV